MKTTWALVLAFLATAAAWPQLATAQPTGQMPDLSFEDVNARGLNVLAVHPYPDPEGDPWGLPYAEVNGSRVDYMRATYDAFLYPTAVFDGVETVVSANQFLTTYHAYETLYEQRIRVDAPLRIRLDGGVQGDALAVRVDIISKGPLESRNATMRAALFEDDVRYQGRNGVDQHRFTLRHMLDPVPLDVAAGERWLHNLSVDLDPAWDRENVGLVVWAVNHDTASRAFQAGEVLQAATFLIRQDGPTVQWSRGVLLEFYTATWCPTCVWGDGAVDELANTYGVTSSRLLDRPYAYLRPFEFGAIGAAVIVGAAVAWTTWAASRRRGEGA